MAKIKDNLDEVITVRVSTYEKNKLRMLADMYAGGNISLWVVRCALDAPRKMLDDDSISSSKRKIKKPQ